MHGIDRPSPAAPSEPHLSVFVMRHLTIRHVPDDLAAAIEAERTRRGHSLNRTVLNLLARALGVSNGARRSNGMARFAGGWTEEDLRRFEDATASSREIDPELWR